MITKVFQGTKKVVEEQLTAYTSNLSDIYSVSLTTTVVEGLEESLPRVIYLTVVVMHEENAKLTKQKETVPLNKLMEVNKYSKMLYQIP